MKLLKCLLILLLMAFLSNCHQNSNPASQKLTVKLEFQKMAWLEGLWSNPDDSIPSFTLWQRSNDSLFSGSCWEMKAKDSIPSEIHEISAVNEDILLSLEIFGKNDGTPDEYKLLSNKNGEHVFESTGKDFPQRIIYKLQPDGSLYIRMEGITEGESRYLEKTLTKIK
jgi:hypothetical protein